MTIVIIKMTALPAKRKELLQTVQALIQSIRKLRGCLNYSAWQDIENENPLNRIEE
jgi:quinol monooxygenase YgiN